MLRRRRLIFLFLNLLTYLGLAAAMATVLRAGGWTFVDGVGFAAFLVATPWTVLGIWNSLIGFWLQHGTTDTMARVAPYAEAGDVPVPLTLRTAVLMTLRNEDPDRALKRLKAVAASIAATGQTARFGWFVLSDTSDEAVAAAEAAAVAAWRREPGAPDAIVYRRRPENSGFKAGNIRDFCDRWGADYELMLPFDADSLMAGADIVRLTRMMQAHPRIGILQSLVVGTPSSSAFARIFQFGMRHGMRCYTMGSAWWTGDCGPFWGHNALVRIAPFREHCELPVLPGPPPLGGAVLSHDQIEAALMRRGGFEVRVLPQECGSYEDNPPTLADYVRRDLRWCLGNMQYLNLMALPGLQPVSRFQLAWAVLMFVGMPAWTLLIVLLPFAAYEARSVPDFPVAGAATLYVSFLVLSLMPKLAGLLDVALTRGGVAGYGGSVHFALSALIEIVVSFLMGAVTTLKTTLFMAGLAIGNARVGWNGQARDTRGLSTANAWMALWPVMLFGIVIAAALAVVSPTALAWAMPLIAGHLLAVPFAVATAAPALGGWFARIGLCAIPEEFETPPEIAALRD